jgi:hypothetical protein
VVLGISKVVLDVTNIVYKRSQGQKTGSKKLSAFQSCEYLKFLLKFGTFSVRSVFWEF